MAKKITPNDLFSEQDIFKGIRKSAEQTIKIMEKLQGELKQTAEDLKKSIGGAKFDSGKAIKNFTKETKEALKVQKEYAQTQKVISQAEQQRQKAIQQAEITEQKRNQTRKTELDLARKQQLAKERENKAKQKAIKIAKDEESAYKKLVKATRDLKNQSKELGAQMLQLEQAGKKNTAEYRKLSEQYNRVTASAKRGDAQLKKLDKTVGDNFRNVGNYKGAISKLSGALGTLGIAFGISTVVRGAFNSITSFEDANAKLSAVLGTTTDKTKDLQAVQRELGRSTSFTAGEVAELQVELAKLGFSQQDIVDSTEGILLLAKASGTDLANASEIAGSTLRAFGLATSETGHLADVMAKSFSSSALDITKFKESMKFVAPVSKSANVSLEETTALLSILANNGIKGSQAGTSLKRIMSEMAKTGKPLKEALQDVADAGIDLTSAQDEVGRSAQTSLLILADNIDKIDGFTESYENADGSAKAMADTMDNTLSGSLARLNSAWEGFLLDMNDGASASNGLRVTLDFLANNLTTITNVVFQIVKAFVLYKATVIAITTAQKLYSLGLKGIGTELMKAIPLTKAYRLEQEKIAKGTAQSTGASAKFGKALAGIGWGLAIGLALELATAIWEGVFAMRTAEKQAQLNAENERKRAEQKERATKQANKNISDISKALEKQISAEETLARRNIATAKTEAEKQKIQKQFLETRKRLVEEAVASTTKLLEKEQATLKNRQEQLKTDKKARADYQQMLKDAPVDRLTGRKMMPASFGIRDVSLESLKVQERQITETTDRVEAYTNALDELNGRSEEATTLIMEHTATVDRSTGATGGATDSQKEINTEYSKTNEYLSRQAELLQKINEIGQDRELIKREKEIDREFSKQLKNLEELGTFDATRLNQLIQEKTDLEKSFIDQRLAYELSAIDEKIKQQEIKESNALLDERQKLIDGANENAEKIAEINEKFSKKEDELIDQQLKRREDAELEKVIKTEEAVNKKVEIEKDGIDSIQDYEEQFTEQSDKNRQTELEKTKEFYNNINTLVKGTADFFIEQSNRKIEQIDKEINKAKEQYDFFKQLAVQGNIDAQQSLAEQQRIIDEAEAKKLKQQRIQQAIELTSSALSTYNNYVSQGKDDALAKTISDIGLLQAFINSLPAFYDGTEDTGKNGRGVDGKGGFNAILHPNERVIPKHLNDRLGGISNEELTDIAQRYKLKGLKADSQVLSALDLSLLGTKIDNLTAVVKDKPETNIELGSITQSLVEIVHKTKKGNTTTYNRFKVKK